MANFTQGPWHTGKPEEKWYLDLATCIYAPDDKEVADCNSRAGSLSRSQAERRANAHLIAAAPELYAACEETEEMIAQIAAAVGDDSLDDRVVELRQQIKRALAKADGESADA